MKIVVLLSAGRHPASGWPRPVPVELQAIGLARLLPGSTSEGLHAGAADAAVLDALGHGIGTVTVLRLPQDADPLPALAAEIAARAPDLVLAGRRGMGGADSGLLPYRLARACNLPIVADAIALAAEAGRLAVTQALPRGARRLVEVALPVVVTVHPAAPAAPAYVHRARLAGQVVARPESAMAAAMVSAMPTGAAAAPGGGDPVEIRPYRARPKLIGDGVAAGSAEARLRAATETASVGGRLMVRPSPEAAAEAIIEYVARFRRA